MSMSVQKSQVHKTATRSQDDDKRLCLVDDLKEVQVHIQVKPIRTSSSLKSKITTSCSQDKVKKTNEGKKEETVKTTDGGGEGLFVKETIEDDEFVKKTTTTSPPPPPQQQQGFSDSILIKRIGELEHHMTDLVSKVVDEIVTDTVDWALQAPLMDRFRDLPEADMKEILHHPIWETNSYTAHEDHKQLKKKKRHASPKTPPGSPPYQPPPPPPPADPPSSSKTAASAQYTAWTTTDSRHKPSVSSIPEDLHMDDDTAPDEQVHLSDDEDIGSEHIPTVNLRQSWWKPLTEDRPATPEPTWSIPSSDLPVSVNNWASALASTYAPPPENSLLAQIGDMATFMDWFYKKQGITELKQQDLEGPAYEIVKVFHPNSGRPALSILKMKAAYYPDVGLEQMVPIRCGLKTNASMTSLLCMVSLTGGSKGNDSTLTDTHLRVIAELLGLTQLNLTKPRWDATGFEFKHDFTVIDSPRAVTFRDRCGVHMITRFNEIHKFSDGTLQQIDEALDYRVKEFKVNKMNSGLNTWFWIRKDVDRSKEFMFAIQKQLKTRRIFRNLESFVGGRIREGDYRLLKRTE
ncbi:hypothetical protein Tco_1081389 [Tanacetum coccineum]|uniref:Uncharacterized protein n=1 Tax=Tanacetum coccineum TaxID=301880 RepID=A0ABQ5HXL0_9ASTR